MERRRFLAWAAMAMAIRCSRAPDTDHRSQESSAPPSLVRLSPEAARGAGIETAIVGEAALPQTLTLTGTITARPWIPEEQTALADAESADAKLRLAQANFNRISRLSADGVAARQDLDEARAERDQAQAAASQADARRANLGLSETSISLERQARIWGLATLPQIDLSRIAQGQAVDVTTSAFPDHRFPGRVVGVSRSADLETHSFTARIAVDDPSGRLHPQMLATFAISTSAPKGLTAPRSALLLEGDGSYVYVAQGDTFRKQRVRVGASSGESVQVIEGLSSGQRIVTRGAQILESERLKSRLRPAEAD